jgi:hypothetical protein
MFLGNLELVILWPSLTSSVKQEKYLNEEIKLSICSDNLVTLKVWSIANEAGRW